MPIFENSVSLVMSLINSIFNLALVSQYLIEISKSFCHVDGTFSEVTLIFVSIVVILYNCSSFLKYCLCGDSKLVKKNIAINKQWDLHSSKGCVKIVNLLFQ